MFYVEKGRVMVVFEQISTKERKELIMEMDEQAVQVPENVALAAKNVGTDTAVLIFFSNNPLRSEDNFEYKLL
jgi:hypothetical protein